MKNRNEEHGKRVKRLAIGCGLCGIILAASTYAWFIGMKTVNVSSFDVKVAAIDSLLLSLDGKTWGNEVAINEDNFQTVNTSNNTNSWGGSEGLVPMSSVGIINTDTSRLTMYEKGSFTQVPGGYRVMASKVRNEGATEAEGYVAFDLFVKNQSGNEYYKNLNVLNEEAIYLTPNSKVSVASTGNANAGIENSVRVAFAQIGRVIGTTTDQATVTGITCDTAGEVTGICANRPAQIWEPNDTAHVANAIKWYDTNCLTRTGDDVTDKTGYGSGEAGKCAKVEDGKAYPTYAISGVIDHTDNVNAYDGEAYNGYTTSVATDAEDGKLVSYPYFTDSMKDIAGVNRPQLLSLAPNSITKIRVYIWIEGQDVDNYDFASLGKQISIAFGFSKEQLYGEDIGYTGEPELDPEVQSRPTTAATTTVAQP